MAKEDELSLDNQLLEAASSDNIGLIQEILANGANINTVDVAGYTPLLLAMWHNKAKSTKLFINMGADINIANNAGITPLMVASWQGHIDIIEDLLKVGTSINTMNLWGETALGSAAINGYINTMYILIEYGANLYSKNREGKTPLELLSGYNKNTFNKHKQELIDLAEQVKWARINAEDSKQTISTGYEYDI